MKTRTTPHGEMVVPVVMAPTQFERMVKDQYLIASGENIEIVARLVECEDGYTLQIQMRLPTEET